MGWASIFVGRNCFCRNNRICFVECGYQKKKADYYIEVERTHMKIQKYPRHSNVIQYILRSKVSTMNNETTCDIDTLPVLHRQNICMISPSHRLSVGEDEGIGELSSSKGMGGDNCLWE
jgi:hypothetical protein